MKKTIVSGKTLVYGVIGSPVEHSLSPIMQNAAFQERGLDNVYLPFNVKSEDIAEAVAGMKALNIRGLNVTIPHKVAVMQHLDEVDEMAAHISAVNTIVNLEGYLKGYNTDASGFFRALTAEKVRPERKNIVILGAGGASRAISFILADKGADLTIINRHLAAAQGITNRIFNLFRREAKALELNARNLKSALSKADILVNTTSVGMTPDVKSTLVPVELLKENLMVFDIVYNPLKTRLLSDAAKCGAHAIGGIEMLVWQGAAAFELWTGQEAPVTAMKKAALKALEQHED